ncbi:DNase I-like protein, partial [Clavulina sp. PMI_390]
MPPKRKLVDTVDVDGEQSSDLSSAPEVRSPSKKKKGATTAASPAAKRGRPSAVKSKDSTADVTAAADAKAAAAVDAGTKKNETTAGSAMPNNKTMPESLSYERSKEGAIRVCAWNVCGLTSSQKKGFKTYVGAEDPDILILTETKLSNRPLDPYLTSRYSHQYWSDAVQGHGGTSILSKLPVIRATYSLPGHEDPSEVAGRLVTLEFEKLFLVGTYVPNAGQGLKFMDRKKAWNVAFEQYIRTLDAQKPVIWAGDLNVVPTALDIKRPKENYNKSAGYTQI